MALDKVDPAADPPEPVLLPADVKNSQADSGDLKSQLETNLFGFEKFGIRIEEREGRGRGVFATKRFDIGSSRSISPW